MSSDSVRRVHDLAEREGARSEFRLCGHDGYARAASPTDQEECARAAS